VKRWLAAFALLMLAQPVLAAERIVQTHIHTHGNQIDLSLELAVTQAERSHGLMDRKTLAPHDGMAFFFPTIAPQKFWMKNTLIPLDILFVDEAGSIVYIVIAKPLSEIPVGPDSPVATVIELAGGRTAKSGITVGDKVTYDIDSRPGAMAH
jgi:uncharacterized protein